MKPIVVLTGPTAVGKTELSIQLAHRINGEIISADSMQVYKGMDIGSAKITREEMDGITHYLVDCLDPAEPFDVSVFQSMANEALEKIYSKGKIPIVVGGTGFYIQALLYEIDFKEEENSGLREKYQKLSEELGPHELHELLRRKDPASAEAIHENNVKRVIRALEYYDLHQSPISLHNQKEAEKPSPYNFAYFVLNCPRELLYDRINRRVDLMLEKGLLDEVKALQDKGFTRSMVSMQGLGYKEILDYLNGGISLEEAVYRIKRDSRHFAKRQLTWFRRERDVIWLNKEEYPSEEAILEKMIFLLKEKNILD